MLDILLSLSSSVNHSAFKMKLLSVHALSVLYICYGANAANSPATDNQQIFSQEYLEELQQRWDTDVIMSSLLGFSVVDLIVH